MIARRLRKGPGLAAATTAGALVLALAPAASAERPAVARDFSQPVPPSTEVRGPVAGTAEPASRAYGAEGPVIYRSEPIRAPRRFDIVGIAGETHAIEYRTRRAGERWSGWAEADNGDPVYAGGADFVQLRSRTVPLEGELHYVSLPPAPKHAPRPVARESAAARRAGVPEPKFVTRRQWGAKQPRGGCEPRDKPSFGKVKAGVIHHTVNTNTYSRAEAANVVLGICRFHRNGNGWDDIGYNALVDRFGTLYQGRAGGMSRAVIGAQAEGVNTYTTGIAAIGDFTSARPSKKLKRGIVRYLAWKFDVHGLEALGRTWLMSAGGESARTPKGKRVKTPMIFSHNFTNFTGCAGAQLIKQIGKIRRTVQKRLDKYGAGGDPGTGGGIG